MIPRWINGMLVNGPLYKAIGRYCVYVFGDTYPIAREKEVQSVRDAFAAGWTEAEATDQKWYSPAPAVVRGRDGLWTIR